MLPNPITVPEWATVPGVDALSGQPNVVEPPVAKRNTGWHYREKPPRNWANWLQKKNAEWISYTDEQLRSLQSDFTPNAFATLPTVTGGPGLFVSVTTAVDRWLNQIKAEQATQLLIPVPPSTTSYLYIDDGSGLYAVSTSIDTAASPNRLILAQITTSGVAVTSLRRIGPLVSHNRFAITVGPPGLDVQFNSLQEAIDHAGAIQVFTTAASVEVVVVGQLPVSTPVNCTRTVRVRGLNLQSLITWSFTAGAPFQLQSGSEFSSFQDLAFEYGGGAPAATHAAILAVGASVDAVRVEGCTLHARCGIRVSGSGQKWMVRGNQFIQGEADTQAGIAVDGAGSASGWHVFENDLAGPAFGSTTPVGLSMPNAVRAMICNNRVSGYGDGISLGLLSTGAIVSGNAVRTAAARGIHTASADTQITGNYLAGCGPTANDGSIRISLLAASRCSVTGNHIVDWQSGFAISSAGTETNISGNTIIQNGGSVGSPVIQGGIQCLNARCTVHDNAIDLLFGATSGAGGKPDVYGIKMGLYGSGPSVAFTSNTAIRSSVCGNSVRNYGNSTTGGVGIDVGGDTKCDGNFFENGFGIGVRVDGTDTSVVANSFFDWGAGPIAAPYTTAGTRIAIATSGSRTEIVGNIGRVVSSGIVTPMVFEGTSAECHVRNNNMQSTALFETPAGLHRQNYGVWEWRATTTIDATVTDLAPALGFVANEAFFVETFVRARRDATNAVAYVIQAIISTDGTGTPTIRTQTTTQFETDQNLTAVYAISGSNLVVRVTGAGGQTWVWRASTTTEKQRLANNWG